MTTPVLWCAGLVLAATVGCGSSQQTGYPHAYRATDHAIQTTHESVAASTIVVGTFDNPATASVRWRTIGSGVAADLARTLRAKTGMQVWANTGLARSASTLTTKGVSDRAPWLDSLARKHPGVHYVVIGRVTDFVHTSDVPQIANNRKGKNRALVAIDFTAIEVETGRILAQDHIVGDTREGGIPSADQYKGIAFGSYLFWETPLGLASRQAIDRVASEIAMAMPLVQGQAVVSAVHGSRSVEVSGGSRLGLKVGQERYLCVRTADAELMVLRDVDTLMPLTVRITSVNNDAAQAWVSGLCDDPAQLQGAQLCSVLPPEPLVDPALDGGEAVTTADASTGAGG